MFDKEKAREKFLSEYPKYIAYSETEEYKEKINKRNYKPIPTQT